MPVHEEQVQLLARDGSLREGLFLWNEDDPECILTLYYYGKELRATEDHYFEAMCTLRKQLETEGLIPNCYGASRRAYPMSRDMGSGLLVYRLTLGRPALRADLVGLFDTGPDVEPATVAEQEAFYDQWIESLRQRLV